METTTKTMFSVASFPQKIVIFDLQQKAPHILIALENAVTSYNQKMLSTTRVSYLRHTVGGRKRELTKD